MTTFIKKYSPIKILILLFFINCFLFVVSCVTSSSKDKASFSGNVVLQGSTDNNGVNISIYKPVELDTTIVRINRDYPNIGVYINQETEFDHRTQSPIKSITTNPDGSFIINDIEPGIYHVVCQKEGWGWKYLLNTSINNHKINNSISLSKEIIIPNEEFGSTISNTLTVEEDQHLVINNNITFMPGSSLVLHSGAVVRIKNNKSVTCYGNATIGDSEEKYIKIISEDEDPFNKLSFYNGLVKIKNAIIDHGNRLLEFNQNNLDINHLILKNGLDGIVINESNGIISNVVLKQSVQDFGISLQRSNSIEIKKSIFLNSTGVRLDQSSPSIKNNVFLNCNNNAIYLFNSALPNIFYNDFLNIHNEAIRISALSHPVIKYNNFYTPNGVSITRNANQSGHSTATINYNNFKTNQYAIKITYTSQMSNNVNGEYNYYYSTDYNYIYNDLIIDRNDYGDEYIIGIINIDPILTSRYIHSGANENIE